MYTWNIKVCQQKQGTTLPKSAVFTWSNKAFGDLPTVLSLRENKQNQTKYFRIPGNITAQHTVIINVLLPTMGMEQRLN